MSIRAIAKDLYKAQQRVHQLEGKLESCSPAGEQAVQDELRRARQELTLLKRIMNGEKESADMRLKFKGFGR